MKNKMETAYPIKETVTVLTIKQPLQKIKFQIRHPENMESIIGIAVTTNKVSDPPTDRNPHKENITGYLTLSIPGKGDIVYGEDTSLDNDDYADLTEKRVFNGRVSPIMYAKKRNYYLDTNIKIQSAIFDGFYEDTYAPDSVGYVGGPLIYLYKVRIYIRYKVKPTNSNILKP